MSKYAHEGAETWEAMARTLTEDVTGDLLPESTRIELEDDIAAMRFIPGGRYLYYAGRELKFFNNCYLLKVEEDTREEWGAIAHRSISCLMTGGGIGIDYSILREKGSPLKRTGGIASGPLSLMEMINEIGRRVMQGGSRRSAIYGSLNWRHPDAPEILKAKDWYSQMLVNTGLSVGEAKERDFNFHAPLDMTNISLNYDNEFLVELYGLPFATLLDLYEKGGADAIACLPIVNVPDVFLQNVRQALQTGEPGFSFNFFEKVLETLRNACTEVTSEDDSDVCNLGSLNMSRFTSLEEFRGAVRRATEFLYCGTLKADLPYEKVYEVRVKNRRLGLGLMGVHEWLMMRGYRYEVVPELHEWLAVYKEESDLAANRIADSFGMSRPVAVRAIAPTGTIGILAGTTTGIEPLFAVAYKRRYLKNGTEWHYQYVVDGTAKILIENYDIKPDDIETALDLAKDPERRIKFQYDVQKYVDMSISSTINLPEWGSELNNEKTVASFARTLAKYAVGLRGFTVYPDGARGGQPLTSVSYYEARDLDGQVFEEEFTDICSLTGGGVCGV